MGTQTYEAVLARPENVQQVRARERAIERIGGRVEIGKRSAAGMTLVRLILPDPYTPHDFVPGLPFFPV
jgi:hypothetical protein